jgi:hypothetical protein
MRLRLQHLGTADETKPRLAEAAVAVVAAVAAEDSVY